MEDKLLIWRFKRGSADAFCRIYEKYESDMLALAISLLNDRSSAEDVVHDVFVSLAQSVEKLRLNGSLKSYLATCTVNRARDTHRARRRRDGALDKVAPFKSELREPPASAIHDEEVHALSRATAQLPYEQREAIALRLRGGMTFKAIAALQDVSINTVRSRYDYGLARLRSLLNGEVTQ